MAIDASRAQLIHIETDRRLGHEWDEWDGGPLPNGGDFSAPPGLFFRYAALTLVVLCAAAAGVLFLLSPRLAAVAPALPRAVGWAVAGAFSLANLWLAALAVSFYGGVALLPERLLERGPFLRLMNLTSQVARLGGRRDSVEHAAGDRAGNVPVLGLRMRLGDGRCRDAMIDLDVMESWVRGLVGA